jgi:hypothetical protein
LETKEFVIKCKHGEFTVIVDADDWEKVSKHRWGIRRDKKPGHAPRWYVVTQIPHPNGGWIKVNQTTKEKERGWRPNGGRRRRRKTLTLHVLINETPKGMVTDHINGNGLDNRKCNLRSVTHKENCQNRGKTICNSSGFKGVRRLQRKQQTYLKPWMATTSDLAVENGAPRPYIGMYATKEEAAEAYDRSIAKYVPEDQHTPRLFNYPEKIEQWVAEKDTVEINPLSNRNYHDDNKKEFAARYLEEVEKLYEAGHTLKEIAKEFNKLGYRTRHGAEWTYVQVSKVLKFSNKPTRTVKGEHGIRWRSKKTGYFGVTFAAAGRAYKKDSWLPFYKTQEYVPNSKTGKRKTHYLGACSTPEEAARIHDEKMVELHGADYPYLNFPDEHRT